jgi:hypothetical protein
MLKLWHAVMAALFLFSVAVQVNDPDPAPWMMMYGAAFVLAVGGVLGRPPSSAALGLGLLVGMWAMALLPSLSTFVARDLSSLDFAMKAGDLIEEEARECGGLLLVCFETLMLVMDAHARRGHGTEDMGRGHA